MRIDTKSCPICREKFVNQGLKNHVINTAKAEAFHSLINIIERNKRDKVEFSSIVLRSCNKHFNYYLKNSEKMPDETRTLKFKRI